MSVRAERRHRARLAWGGAEGRVFGPNAAGACEKVFRLYVQRDPAYDGREPFDWELDAVDDEGRGVR